MIRIAVDAMSGDLGPRVAILAALQLAEARAGLELILVGDQAQLEAMLPPQYPPAIKIHHAADVVTMSDDPRLALRRKRESSMWQALSLVQQGEADACVSAGNTGALMAMSRFLLKTLPGIERPAICKAMPVIAGQTYMLDLGANHQCTVQQLHQFALMGHALARSDGIDKPSVALLNIGVEPGKGTNLVVDAHERFEADAQLNYVGFIEADTIYNGVADVIVCDGFSGNIALKASEGVARLINHKIETSLAEHWSYRFLAWLVRPLLLRWRRELNPGTYNGALFLGLNKAVIKSHGSADQIAFCQAIDVAVEQVRHPLSEIIEAELRTRSNAD
ncbi:phosphate acyltransferase PlsX [Marinimicrobium sp. ABcell2]|uniref:phosphate acyltransferase PlsX n=1 Tax=Marinimicrobium sp. ABcell2 TaxID=3069751 RepID=UPI0027B79427|nr:phosphate acyltransferase PlsX [Marinimicrobium sp. ABcell2]MDQ2075673.1 phosphate acyltransferase PlsX [Marinimicrobium sp. ABcell2]